jgi:ABC-2 type transport system permease protein
MIRALQAELVKLLRARVLVATAAIAVVAGVGGAAIVLSAAQPAGPGPERRGATIEQLADAGGGTDVFRQVASFSGTFLFVVFVGAVAVEFSRGTFRTMVLQQPARLRLIAGKMAGLLVFAGAVLGVALVATWVAAKLIAPSQDIESSEWISLSALGDAVVDYGTVLYWVIGYAVLGMALAVVTRSMTLALAVAVAWAGPIEHLIQESWEEATRVFPGLLLEAFVIGGVPEGDVSTTRAFVTVAVWLAAATALAGRIIARRDVTG